MSLATRVAAAALAATAITAPGVAQAAPAPAAAPHVAVASDTSSPAPSSSTVRPVTQGEGGDKTFGYVLGLSVLAVFGFGAAWFLRTRRRPR